MSNGTKLAPLIGTGLGRNTMPKDPLPKLKPLTGGGLSKDGDTGYGSQLLPGVSPEDYKSEYTPVFVPSGGIDTLNRQRADDQRWYQYLGRGFTTLSGRLVGEVLKMPASLGIAVGESMDQVLGTNLTEGDTYASSFENNAWLNFMDEFSEGVAEAIPLYERDRNKYGGFVKTTLLNPHFYATQGADAIGFAGSFLTPGIALKVLNVGSKASKLMFKGISSLDKGNRLGIFKTAQAIGATGNNLDLALATSFSTFFESASESRESMKSLRASLENSGLTPEEIDERVNTAGRNVFTANMAILTGPNLLLNKMLLGRFKGAVGKRFKIKGEGLKAQIEHQALTGNKKYAKIAKDLGLGIFSEGFVEELSQATVAGFYERAAEEGVDRSIIGSFFKEYLDTLGTTEGQQALFLGALMGGAMGGGMAYQNIKNSNKEFDFYINKMNSNMNAFSQNITKPFKKDTEGNVEYNKVTNRPIIDNESLKDATESQVSRDNTSELLEYALATDNHLLYDEVFNSAFTDLVIPYTQVEGGLEILNQQLEGIFDILVEANPRGETATGEVTQGINGKDVKVYTQELLNKAKKIQSYTDLYSSYINSSVNALNRGKLTDKEFDTFSQITAISFIENMSMKDMLNKQIADINKDEGIVKEVIGVEEEKFKSLADLQLSYLNTLLENTEKNINQITNQKGLERRLAEFKTDNNKFKNDLEETSERAKDNKAKTKKKKDQQKKEQANKESAKVDRQKRAKQHEEDDIRPFEVPREEEPLRPIPKAMEPFAERATGRELSPEESLTEEEFFGESFEGTGITINKRKVGNAELDAIADAEDFGTDMFTFEQDAEYHGKDTVSDDNVKQQAESKAITEDIEKNDRVAKVIGANDKIQPQYGNITQAYVAWLSNFASKTGTPVNFTIDNDRPQYIAKIREKANAILKGTSTLSKEKQREFLINQLPINAVFEGVGLEAPTSKGQYKKDKVLLGRIVDELLAGNDISNISSVVTFQAPGNLNITKEATNNILDLEYVKNDLDNVSLSKVNKKGSLINSKGDLIGVNRGTRKSGSIYLETKNYLGEDIYISLDTRKINEYEAEIIVELLQELINSRNEAIKDKKKKAKIFIKDINKELQDKVYGALKKEIKVINKGENSLRIADVIDFLIHTNSSTSSFNLFKYDAIKNKLTIGTKVYNNLDFDTQLEEVYKFLLNNKNRRVQFENQPKTIKNQDYLRHMIVDEILTTNVNTKTEEGEQLPMFKGNVNIYIDNEPTVKTAKVDPEVRKKVETIPTKEIVSKKITIKKSDVTRSFKKTDFKTIDPTNNEEITRNGYKVFIKGQPNVSFYITRDSLFKGKLQKSLGWNLIDSSSGLSFPILSTTITNILEELVQKVNEYSNISNKAKILEDIGFNLITPSKVVKSAKPQRIKRDADYTAGLSERYLNEGENPLKETKKDSKTKKC